MIIAVRIEVTPAHLGVMEQIVAHGANKMMDKEAPEKLAVAEEQLYNILRRIRSEIYGEKA